MSDDRRYHIGFGPSDLAGRVPDLVLLSGDPERTKHIDIRHHFLKQHVAKGDVRLQYLPTAQQPADALTKAVDKIKVSLFSQLMLGSA